MPSLQLRSSREALLVGLGLLGILALRCLHPTQPIWENYIGRQVPTAMVARNLVKTLDVLHPQVDTGPFPNYFLVEPPVYAGLVAGFSRVSGLPLEMVGRIISALALTLAAWGLFGLVRPRESLSVALVTLLLFGLFPVSIRYGRAFQPDALMLGLSLAGLRFWQSGKWFSAWLLLWLGLATKVTGAFLLLLTFLTPGLPDLEQRRRWRTALFCLLCLCLAGFWYGYAAWILAHASAGTMASAEIAQNWRDRLAGWGRIPWTTILRDLTLRAFTPVGFSLLIVGLANGRRLEWIWRAWILAVCLTLLVLAGKLHHEYYWLMAAPPFAIVAARGWGWVSGRSVVLGRIVLILFTALAVWQTRSTWFTPAEWVNLSRSAETVRQFVPREDLIVAPEALIYASDRRGCRLEWEPRAIDRVASEWRRNVPLRAEDPVSLVDFYKSVASVRWFADLQGNTSDPRRVKLHDRVRNQPGNRTLVDEPDGLLLIRLAD